MTDSETCPVCHSRPIDKEGVCERCYQQSREGDASDPRVRRTIDARRDWNDRQADGFTPGDHLREVAEKDIDEMDKSSESTTTGEVCRVPGCGKPARLRGVCYACYAYAKNGKDRAKAERIEKSMLPAAPGVRPSGKAKRKPAQKADEPPQEEAVAPKPAHWATCS